MNLIQMSVSAGIFILFCVIVRLVMVNKLPKRFFLFLWAMVLCKLLIPMAIPAKWSIYPYIKQWALSLRYGSGNITEGIAGFHTMSMTALSSTVTSRFYENPWFLLWGAVAVLFLAFFLASYWHWSKKLAVALPVKGQPMIEQWLQEHPIKRHVAVMVSDQINTPLTYGVLRPKIILPKRMDYQNELQLKCILAHEWAHIRQFDALWKLLLTVTCCLHWFNPFVWLLYWFANRDLELACDEKVVKYLGEEYKSQYALSLINMADKNFKLSPLYSNFSKNSIEERIISIMKFKKTSMIGMSLGLLMALGATAVFATTAPEAKVDAIPMQKYAVAVDSVDAQTIGEAQAIDLNDLKPVTAEEYAKQIEAAKAEMHQKIEAGEVTQEEADQAIANMEKTLKDIKNGDYTVYQSDNLMISYTEKGADMVENGGISVLLTQAIPTTPATSAE